MLNRVEDVDNFVKINNVLISVSDKSGVEEFVKNLININSNIKIYSTGGTYNVIKNLLGDNFSKNLVSVSDWTNQPEMQGGLVKTLDFKIYLGILSETYNESHQADIKRVAGINFDMVVVNLYPFKKTVAESNITVEDARTNIDIGGPCMLRASAKNFLRVASVCNPEDYNSIIEELKKNSGKLTLSSRLNFAKKSFCHTADYDKAISEFLLTKDENSLSVYKIKE